MRNIYIVLFLPSLLLLSACSALDTGSTQRTRDVFDTNDMVTYQKEVDNDIVLSDIKKAANKIQKSLNQLAHVRKSQSEKNKYNVYREPKDRELSKHISFKWAGSLELAAKILSEKIHYDFKIIGDKPIRPVTANIDVEDTPIFRVFEKIGWQSEDKATLLVDERKGIVQLVYEGL